jgi:hypothetical protein
VINLPANAVPKRSGFSVQGEVYTDFSNASEILATAFSKTIASERRRQCQGLESSLTGKGFSESFQ